jgi:hypothetical protein
MPYGAYIRVAFDYWRSESGKRRSPLPNQLYSPEVTERALRKWSDPSYRITFRPFELDWDLRFFVEHHTGDPVQASIAAFVSERVNEVAKGGQNRSRVLGRYLGTVITRAEAEAYFPAALVNEAAQEVFEGEWPRPAGSPTKYVPGCLGYGPIQMADECISCSFATECAAAKALAKNRIEKRHGSSDPKRDRRRESDRLRQRRHRNRLKDTQPNS